MVASTRGFRGTVRRRVALFAGGALLVTGAVWSAPGTARADAGNPILGTIHGSLQPNPDGTVTVFVRGQWNWLSHNSDCNFDRAATGVGMIWNDPTEPGFTVTKAPISAGVGIAAIRSGTAPAGANPNAYPDTYNTGDEMVHPVDRATRRRATPAVPSRARPRAIPPVPRAISPRDSASATRRAPLRRTPTSRCGGAGAAASCSRPWARRATPSARR